MYTHTQLVIFDLIFRYSYFIILPLAIVEGPIITLIAGFLVAMGFLDFIPALLTLILGDIIGDSLYYSAGRWWLKSVVTKLFTFFNVNMKNVKRLENAMRRHVGKVLFFGKLSHAASASVLFAAGNIKIPFDKFIWFSFLGTLPKTLVLLLVGYYFGSTITNFTKYLNFTILGLFIFTIILLGLYFLVTYFADKIISRLEK